jgi:glycosyltransferase involved in cell wall biosynthesis
MKIAFLITKSNWGGAQKYVYELATSLPRDTYDVCVIAGGAGPLTERLGIAGIRIISIDSLSNATGFIKEIKTLRDLWVHIRAEQPDVLHINSSKAGILGAGIGRILRVPKIIFTAHGWAFNEQRPLYQKCVLKVIHWLTLICSHHTIAVSENIKSSFDGWPLLSGNITVIHNGIQAATGYARAGARHELANMFPQLKKILEHKHIHWIGTIAELHPVKNLDGALRAMSILLKEHTRSDSTQTSPRFLYTITGEGRERTYLEKMITDLELSEHVFLLGHIPDAFQYIKAFDSFLLPSHSEALAYVLLEAGLQEVPVVATAVGGIPEIIDDMTSGILIQPRKPTEIAHAIEFYVEHPHIAKQYAHVLHEKIKKDFTLERMVSETRVVYGK